MTRQNQPQARVYILHPGGDQVCLPPAGSMRSNSHSGHLVAGRGTTAAGFGAALHLGIVAHLLTIGSAGFVHLSTRATGLRMKLGSTQHEVCRGAAHLGAILQELDVRGFGVRTTLRQTVSNCACTDAMAIQAILNALLHALIQRLVGRTLHGVQLLCPTCSAKSHLVLITKQYSSISGRIYSQQEGFERARIN